LIMRACISAKMLIERINHCDVLPRLHRTMRAAERCLSEEEMETLLNVISKALCGASLYRGTVQSHRRRPSSFTAIQ
jgi:hypothetical protein